MYVRMYVRILSMIHQCNSVNRKSHKYWVPLWQVGEPQNSHKSLPAYISIMRGHVSCYNYFEIQSQQACLHIIVKINLIHTVAIRDVTVSKCQQNYTCLWEAKRTNSKEQNTIQSNSCAGALYRSSYWCLKLLLVQFCAFWQLSCPNWFLNEPKVKVTSVWYIGHKYWKQASFVPATQYSGLTFS
jgi:hypothetical protein